MAWINQFYQALLEADSKIVLELIQEIPQTDPVFIQSLIKLVRGFQFEDLVDLVEPLMNNNEPAP